MAINKKMKRFLCLALVCLMLTPIISFATNDDTTGEETTDTTEDAGTANTETDGAVGTGELNWIDNLKSGATQAATVDAEAVLAEKEFLKLPFNERKEIAKAAGVVEKAEEIEGHKFVCSNGGYELYLKEENCSIILRCEETGAIIRSTITSEQAAARGYQQAIYDSVTNGILVKPITYTEGSATSRFGAYQDGIITAVTGDYIKYEKIDNGVVAHVNYTPYGFEFDVKMTLSEEGAFTYEIPISSLKETNESYIMASLQVFTLLGYTGRGDREGYMILPDGNGITVNYEDYFQGGVSKYKTPYSKQVYGSDEGINPIASNAVIGTDLETSRDFTSAAEKITIPYFGFAYTDTNIAAVGLIEEGEYNAYIECTINGVNRSFENYVSPKFVYRTLYTEYTDSVGQSELKTTSKKPMIEDVKVTYLLTSGDQASYSGLATKLREHLLKVGIINAAEDQEFDLRLDFLGVDKENFLVFRRNVVATTVDDIREMLNKLSDLGVKNVLAIYEGWQSDGVYNIPIYEFDADGDIGGNSAIEDLFADLEEGGTVEFYLTADMLQINTSLTSSVFTSINAYTGKTYERYEMFNEVFTTFRYLFPEKSAEYIKDLVEDLLDSEITNVAFSGISDNLFVYQEDKENFTRKDSMGYYEEALKSAKEDGMNIVLEAPYMYLWKYTDEYLDFSVGSSMYVYTSDEIPFLSSVLKGTMNLYSEYVNFEANSTEHFLKLVETGVLPSFLITKESPSVLQYTNSNWIYSSEYDKYEETIVKYYNELKAVNDKTEGAYIVNHEKNDSDVSITTYSNGVKVYVNFSEYDVTVDDITIEAESYVVR